MEDQKSIGKQILSFVSTIAGAIATIIVVLLLLIIVPNIMRGCQAAKADTTQQK